MGMSTSVYGIIPADEKFHKMKDIYDRCEELGVVPPEEVIDFFDGERPDASGVVMWLEGNSDAITEYNHDMQQGYEVEISKLDPNIKILRFVNSW